MPGAAAPGQSGTDSSAANSVSSLSGFQGAQCNTTRRRPPRASRGQSPAASSSGRAQKPRSGRCGRRPPIPPPAAARRRARRSPGLAPPASPRSRCCSCRRAHRGALVPAAAAHRDTRGTKHKPAPSIVPSSRKAHRTTVQQPRYPIPSRPLPDRLTRLVFECWTLRSRQSSSRWWPRPAWPRVAPPRCVWTNQCLRPQTDLDRRSRISGFENRHDPSPRNRGSLCRNATLDPPTNSPS